MSETNRRGFGDAATVDADIGAGRAAERGIEGSPVSLTVNGRACTIMVEARATLLDALRDELELTGTKNIVF
jgi:xanthine dehydrogenase YagT iron-sulfur-binding subunit